MTPETKGILTAASVILLVVVGLGTMMFFIKKDADEYHAEQAERAQREVDECYEHGGIWTPVGGDRYTVIYGCVFPPAH